jgi:hypothetical protein
MRYEVRVSDGSRFELGRDEPLIEGEFLHQSTMIYKVQRVVPTDLTDENFDAIAEVEWMAGPAEAGFRTE